MSVSWWHMSSSLWFYPLVTTTIKTKCQGNPSGSLRKQSDWHTHSVSQSGSLVGEPALMTPNCNSPSSLEDSRHWCHWLHLRSSCFSVLAYLQQPQQYEEFDFFFWIHSCCFPNFPSTATLKCDFLSFLFNRFKLCQQDLLLFPSV